VFVNDGVVGRRVGVGCGCPCQRDSEKQYKQIDGFPRAGQLLIRNQAASVNFADIDTRRNNYPLQPPLPHILGSEFAGVVEEIGEGVSGVKMGDRVFGIVPAILARQKQMGLLPDDVELSAINPHGEPDITGPDGQPWPQWDVVRPWDSLSSDGKRLFARMAEVYAGSDTIRSGNPCRFMRRISHIRSTPVDQHPTGGSWQNTTGGHHRKTHVSHGKQLRETPIRASDRQCLLIRSTANTSRTELRLASNTPKLVSPSLITSKTSLCASMMLCPAGSLTVSATSSRQPHTHNVCRRRGYGGKSVGAVDTCRTTGMHQREGNCAARMQSSIRVANSVASDRAIHLCIPDSIATTTVGLRHCRHDPQPLHQGPEVLGIYTRARVSACW
jgi:hypothetical protein